NSPSITPKPLTPDPSPTRGEGEKTHQRKSIMAGLKPGPMCRSRQAIDVDDGTLCLIESSPPRPVGTDGDGVAQWSMERKLLEAARRVTPKLPPKMRAQFASLFSGTNLAITGGVLTLWGASHLIGVGEVVDAGLVVVGTILL